MDTIEKIINEIIEMSFNGPEENEEFNNPPIVSQDEVDNRDYFENEDLNDDEDLEFGDLEDNGLFTPEELDQLIEESIRYGRKLFENESKP